MPGRGRFAPTPSGPAHPGTLLAALLSWLDARSRGDRFSLRLEDLDRERCTPALADEMRRALEWLGLDWDAETVQSGSRARHAAALADLRERGLVYPCRCSRSEIRRAGLRAADGGFRYPGTCRDAGVDPSGDVTWRLRLEPGVVAPRDESGLDLSQDPLAEMGDPVLTRRGGAVAYHLAVVVDDEAEGVTRVVRGRDLVPSTAIQVVLQRLLGLATPSYRHHLLLLESSGGKLAKLHGAVGWRELRERYEAPAFCGLLAHFAGLAERPDPAIPAELRAGFSWDRVRQDDLALRWTGDGLVPLSG